MKRKYTGIIAVANNKNHHTRSFMRATANKVVLTNTIYGKVVRQSYDVKANNTNLSIGFTVNIPKYLSGLSFRCRIGYMKSYIYIDTKGVPMLTYKDNVEGFNFYMASYLFDILNEINRLKTDAFKKIYKLSIEDPSVFNTSSGLVAIDTDLL